MLAKDPDLCNYNFSACHFLKQQNHIVWKRLVWLATQMATQVVFKEMSVMGQDAAHLPYMSSHFINGILKNNYPKGKP